MPTTLPSQNQPEVDKEELAPSLRFRSVTVKSVLLSLILLPINAYWVVQMEIVRYSAHPTTISLFFNIVFILLVLTLINKAVGHFFPRAMLTRAELLFIYSVLAIGSCLTGHDMMEILVPTLSWLTRDTDESRKWTELFGRYFPKWCMITDPAISKGYYRGNDSLYHVKYIEAWLPVALIWCGVVGALLFVMLCINAILRKQWTDNEKLTYPIVQLPLQITNEQAFTPRTGLFRNWVFWVGFGIAASIDIINSLNVYFPSIPTILTPGRGASFYDASQWITQKPWNAIGWTPLSFYPFMIGLGMLMPLDFLFSCWFFYLFWKMESVMTVAMAWDKDPLFPYANDQAFGAYIAFCVYTVWLSRGYLKETILKALGQPTSIDDSNEPISYRGAYLGIAAGMGVVIWFSSAIGMGPWLPFAFFAIYFALALAITRMRAELGTPVHDLHFTGPDWILTTVFGERGTFSGGQLAAFSLFFWFNRAYRAHPMPQQLESFKMAEQSKADYKSWFWGLAVFGLIGGLAGFWAILHLMYSYGASAKSTMTFGPEAYSRLEGWIKSPQNPSYPGITAIAIGFSIAMLLQWMRVQFAWWPFHPLAFAVTSSWEINLVWLPLFIAWLFKTVILRYSGRKGLQKSMPFFFGLMLGQFVIGSILNIWGIIFQMPTYQFWQ